MPLFQVIVYAIVRGFSEFFPISSSAHMRLVTETLGWSVPSDLLQGYFSLGTLLALILYFRHDWASMISSFIGVLAYRKKPMSPDERMPFFILITALPLAIASYYTKDSSFELLNEPLWLAISVALGSIPLIAGEYWGRRTKGIFDWNWLDSIAVGLGQLLALIPGCGRLTGSIAAGMLRNYNREATAKFAFFASVPVLTMSTIMHFQGDSTQASAHAGESSWMMIGVATTVACFASLLAIGGFMKHVQRKSLAPHATYRWVFAFAMGGVIWARSRGLL